MSITHIGHYINGQVAAGTSGRSQSVTNPATGAVTGSVALANSAEVAQAVGLAPIYYRQIELGRRRPSTKLVERLAALFGLDPKVLLALRPGPQEAPPRPSAVVPVQTEEQRAAEAALDARVVARLLREDKDAAALAKAIGWKGTR